jgi:hypothetical protein
MRHTNTEFLNTLAPPLVRFDASPAGGSLVINDQTPYAIYLNVPANYDFGRNPTKELFDRLSELKRKYSLASLPNSTLPSDSAFQNARDFVLTLPLTQIVKPAIHVASDGEVNFQWSGPDFQIDLGFYGDGKFSFYGAKEGCEPIVGDEVSVKDGIPRGLVDFASAV